MAEKIQRQTQKIFGGNAPTEDLAVFGSFKTGSPIYTDNIEDLQSAAYEEGWGAGLAANEAPFMEEMNGLQYGLSKQIAYCLQAGMPEWDSGTEYFINSFCQVEGIWYKSLTDNNIGNNPKEDTTNWEELKLGGSGGGVPVGTVAFTQGAVDETKGLVRKLNGQLVANNANTQGFFNWLEESSTLNPDMLCTEEQWQATITASTEGICDKFVFDKTANTIRLPKYPDYMMKVTDFTANGGNRTVKVMGTGKALGMTDGTNLFSPSVMSTSVNVTSRWTNKQGFNTPVGTELTGSNNVNSSKYYSAGVVTDPEKSGLTGSVNLSSLSSQAEKIAGTWYIQIATGSETEVNITNEIELNNPSTLFDSKYSPNDLYNASWLKSEGQWNSKAVYITCYEGLQVEHNTEIAAGTTVTLPSGTSYTKLGLSVKLVTESYDDYDFVINTTDETFRLPLLDGSENLPSSRYDEVELLPSDSTYIAPANGWYSFDKATNATGQYMYIKNMTSGSIRKLNRNPASSSSTTAVMYCKRGDAVNLQYTTAGNTNLSRFVYAKGNGSLYFYVGKTVQNATSLIDAGRITEIVTQVKAEKLDKSAVKAYLTETYQKDTSWYRVYSDGWCEQGGYISTSSATVTFLKPFKDTNYSLVGGLIPGNPEKTYEHMNFSKLTASGFEFKTYDSYTCKWLACGYTA